MSKLGELKLNSSPEEAIKVVIDEVVYDFRQLWNTLGFWTIDILTDDNTVPLVYGVKLVSGSFLLQQYVDIPFDIKIDSEVDPTRSNIENYILEIYSKWIFLVGK